MKLVEMTIRFVYEMMIASRVGFRTQINLYRNTVRYLLLFITIICGTISRSGRVQRSVIKVPISKWNHFFIELSSWPDINYRALACLALVFLLPSGMLYKNILFSNYLWRSERNIDVNFAIIQYSDWINSYWIKTRDRFYCILWFQ